MSRAIFKNGHQRSFLDSIKKKSSKSLSELSIYCNRNKRTLNDWYNERTTIPYPIVIRLSEMYNVPLYNIKEKPDFWHTKQAGRLGAISRNKKYGNPGTKDGRRLGGIRSTEIQTNTKSKFITRKLVKIPQTNESIAELIGILLGDGGISKYQIGITLNNKTDSHYANWLSSTIENLFNVNVHRSVKDNTLELTMSGINLVEYFLEKGLKSGSKIKNQTNIPPWILKNKRFLIACLRGLVDTDGSIYFDKHKYKDKIYKNIAIDFTSYSPVLLETVYKSFIRLGLRAKKYTNRLRLRRFSDVERYFKIIGTSNPKHLRKFKNFAGGGVA